MLGRTGRGAEERAGGGQRQDDTERVGRTPERTIEDRHLPENPILPPYAGMIPLLHSEADLLEIPHVILAEAKTDASS